MDNILPNENIDPRLKKDKKFLLEYVKAVWNTNNTGSFQRIFFRNQAEYEENMDYFLGMQSNSKYKPLMGVQEADQKTWLNIDWNIRKILTKFVNIAINKLLEREFTTICTPIDPLAKDENDKHFADIKAKMVMREVLKKAGSELVDSPVLRMNEGEPKDEEELKMQIQFGAKTNLAMEAELGIEVVFNENNIKEQRRQNITHLAVYGPGAYKDYLDENMRVKTRPVDPRFFGTNYCRKGDFSDMTQAWEVIEVPLSDLAVVFNDDKIIEEIRNSNANRNYATGGSTGTRGWVQGYDPNKARVVDLEFISYDKEVKEVSVNSKGNISFVNADYQYRNKKDKVVTVNGKIESKYSSKKVKNVYKIKWVIGTDYCYDYGLATNSKTETDPRKQSEAKLSYHVFAPNFHEMKCNCLVRSLIPLADEYQLTIYKIQNFKNTWIPYVIDIDLGVIEEAALGAGGEKMKPSEILKMMFQSHVLVGRRKDLGGATGNAKSVNIESTNMANEFMVLSQDLDRIVAQMRDISGLNEVTDGSVPAERNLNSTNAAAETGTNNALAQLAYADKWLLESLAKGVLQRLQVAVAVKGEYSGYYSSLGANSINFFNVSKNICLHYYGIKLEERINDEQKAIILTLFQEDMRNGLLNTPEAYTVLSMYNSKQAIQYLSYVVQRNKDQQQQQALQMSAANAKAQETAGIAVEAAKRKTLQEEYKLKTQLEEMKKAWDYVTMVGQGKIAANNIILKEALGIIGGQEAAKAAGEIPMTDMNNAAPQAPQLPPAAPEIPEEVPQEGVPEMVPQ